MYLSITIPGECKTKNRRGLRVMKTKRGAFPQSYKTAEARSFEAKISDFALFARNDAGYHGPTDKALEIEIIVYRKLLKSASKKSQELMRKGVLVPITRPDLDNYEKPIMDALTGVVYSDDSQVVKKQSCKLYDDGKGQRVEITVKPFVPNTPED